MTDKTKKILRTIVIVLATMAMSLLVTHLWYEVIGAFVFILSMLLGIYAGSAIFDIWYGKL